MERVFYQIGREAVVPRFDRGMRGENAFLARVIQRILELLATSNFFTHQFQREKGGVTFVHVESPRPHAQRAQKPNATDAEENFLHDARGAVPTVNPQGQIAKTLFVLRTI